MKIFMITGLVLFSLNGMAIDNVDSDTDGVIDSVDLCPNTPFFATVDKSGCVKKRLYLPEDKSSALISSAGFGYITNEDLIGRKQENISNIKIAYYDLDWSITLKSGYHSHSNDDGLEDTILQYHKYFKYGDDFKFDIGAGIKFPTYDFDGNRIDITNYFGMKYYLLSSTTIFSGFNYTFVNDKEIELPLGDSYHLYLGVGKFFTKSFYANISYSHQVSKFKDEESINNLSSTLYLKIDDKYYTTLTYQRDILDEDLHDSLMLNLHCKIW